MKVDKYNMNEEGLNRFFGPLEARIMERVWETGKASIKEVQELLDRESPISFNAVMTVMNRLCEKGHLIRLAKQSRGQVSYYSAVQTKEQFLNEQTRVLADGLMTDFGALVVNHLIDSLDQADPQSIERLEQKLREMKSRGES
ncbi:BlaI/MecI/CopY family transcriptional regulator [Paenibacillus sp. J2TS4]|uniref:BlaI/MecI/CopY family transcriptional regulator n=1 Tax=Paenibacillus sp. J2TS4 TaxID=2807194 RepID=UPI001B14FBAA|nr:BlaI/MecI/CopY family transcriptional regulator [Paenibacillus sp. J2TS4]GIP33215.1 transcriptional regulator [Paenibacillus sp. J2TS4]